MPTPPRIAALKGLVSTTLLSLALTGPALADRIRNPTAVFAGLDKITGRITMINRGRGNASARSAQDTYG